MVGIPNIPLFVSGLYHPLILTIDPITSCPGHPSSSHPSFRILSDVETRHLDQESSLRSPPPVAIFFFSQGKWNNFLQETKI